MSRISTLDHRWGARDGAADQRRVWFRLPDQVGGFEIYTAVVDDGVRTPEEFRRWLAGRGLPQA
jgi:hypothetical protein